jgi:hypothetical protein
MEEGGCMSGTNWGVTVQPTSLHRLVTGYGVRVARSECVAAPAGRLSSKTASTSLARGGRSYAGSLKALEVAVDACEATKAKEFEAGERVEVRCEGAGAESLMDLTGDEERLSLAMRPV